MASQYRRTRREALVALVVWVIAGCWVVGVSFALGQQTPGPVLLGLPAWGVWGILLPWVVFFLFHCWYSLRFMADDRDEPPPGERPGRDA